MAGGAPLSRLVCQIAIMSGAIGLALAVMASASGTMLVAARQPLLAAAFTNRGAIVQSLLRGMPPPKDPRALAIAGIGAVPALPVAWHALAIDAAAHGRAERARAYLAIADRWTRRDTDTQIMAYRDAMARGDASEAMRHADPLLRRGRMRAELFADIGRHLSEDTPNLAVVAAFTPLLAAAPGWRADYFATAAATTSGAGIDVLLARLHSLGSPLIRTEAQPLLAGLVARGQARRAAAIWARYLAISMPAGLLPWPEAAARAAPTAFDWRLSRDVEPFVSIEGDRLRLESEISGRLTDVVTRTLVLVPGAYRIAAEDASPSDGWRWTLACNGQGAGRSRLITDGDVIIPAECGHVVLTLSFIGGDGTASIGLIRLTRLR